MIQFVFTIIVGLLAALNLAYLVADPTPFTAGFFAVTAICFVVTFANYVRSLR